MANRIPLVVNSSNYRIEELPSGDTLDVNGASITGATFTGIATFNSDIQQGTNGNRFLTKTSPNIPTTSSSLTFVGIGTEDPTRKIDVVGNGYLYGDYDVSLRVTSTSSLGNGPNIVLNNNASSTAYGSGKSWAIVSTGTSEATGSGNFIIRDQTGGSSAVNQGQTDYLTILSKAIGLGQTQNGSAHDGAIGFGCTSGKVKSDLFLSKYASGEGVGIHSSYSRELAMWIINTAPDGRSLIGLGTNYGNGYYGYLAYNGRTYPSEVTTWGRPRSTTLISSDAGGLELVSYGTNSPTTDGGIRFYAGTDNLRMTIRNDQLGVGIGTSVPGTPLHLVGAFTFQNRGTPSTQTALHINTTTGVVVETASSRRYKRDIEDYTKGLETVLQLRPVSFKYQDDENPNAGLIAEEVNELGLPEFVRYDAENAPHSIPYENFTALLINAIKDLKAENDALKARLDAAGL